MFRPAAVVAFLAFSCLAAVARADSALEAALAADRAFARRAADVGAQSAFLEFLAPDAVLFRPLAVNGADWLRSHEEATGALEWAPATGRAGCDGRLAVTIGPWSYRQDSIVATGYYLTLWRRTEAGEWRAVLDHGIDVATLAGDPAPPSIAAAVPAPEAGCPGAKSADELAGAEARLNALAGDKGPDVALRRSLAPGALALRDGHAPAAPTADWPRDAAQWTGRLDPVTRGLSVEQGSDLGYSYGELVARPKRKAPGVTRAVYVRVWARDGHEWRVLIDLTTAVPTPGAAP